MADKISLQPVRGVRDFYPEDMRIRQWLFTQWRAVAAQFGFEEYDSCVLESEELYVRKAGDEITAQLYNFADKGERAVALRPEMTPSMARMVLARQGSLSLPLRWFAIPQCFRYERVQAGRKREHFQWNMDIVGLSSMAAEVELMTAQATFLQKVGLAIDDVIFKVSNRQVVQHYLSSLGIDDERFAAVCVVMDKRGKIPDEKLIAAMAELHIDVATARKILDLLDVRGIEQLAQIVGPDNPGYQALQELITLAMASGIGQLITIDLSVIRGLSYYTGTVWELFDASGGVPRALAGGGRYDRLLAVFGGKPTPMVGFGFGDVTIGLLLAERGLLPDPSARIDDVVYPLSAPEFLTANKIASFLRAQGRRVLVDYSERRFKHVIKMAEEVGAEYFYILGSNEVAAGIVKRRNMAIRDEQVLPLTDVGVEED